MAIWQPHDALPWLTHVIFGFAAMGGALVALATSKGSRAHRLAGHVFVWPMAVAALTALAFVGGAVGPLAYVMSAATLYLLATSMLAVRNRLVVARWLEKPLVLVPLVLCAFSLMVMVRSVSRGAEGLADEPLWAPFRASRVEVRDCASDGNAVSIVERVEARRSTRAAETRRARGFASPA